MPDDRYVALPPALARDLTGATEAHRRLLRALSNLSDADARRPSRLPGWTVGHVVTHLARNADSFVSALTLAARGELGLQYPHGAEGRVGDIEAGAGRDAAALVDDVARSTTALERAWSQTPATVWRDGQGCTVSGRIYPLADVAFGRWREVEVHTADLGLAPGPVWTGWSEGYLAGELDRTLPGLADRLAPGTAVRLTITDDDSVVHVPVPDPDAASARLSRGELVAWLTGRARPEGLPDLPPFLAPPR
jgi:maleylpyruvate isomerase